MNLDQYAFSKHPSYVEAEAREGFKRAVPLRTVVVYCYDPRAAGIPARRRAVLPGEVYPGEIIREENGNKVASTASSPPSVPNRASTSRRSTTGGILPFRIMSPLSGAMSISSGSRRELRAA